MANRAYLYGRDRELPHYDKSDQVQREGETAYYDSRHTIPWGWFFLFREPDLKWVPGQDVQFVAERSQALAIFAERFPLIRQMAGQAYESEAIFAKFVADINSWSERYLILDPSEVFEGEPEDFAHCQGILTLIDDPSANPIAIAAAVRRYSRFRYENQDDFSVNAVGTTYAL